jgi:hypothetical protein
VSEPVKDQGSHRQRPPGAVRSQPWPDRADRPLPVRGEVRVSVGVPAGNAYVVDGSRVAVVIRKDGTVEADRSARFTYDVTVVQATLRLAWAVPYAEAVLRIYDAP